MLLRWGFKMTSKAATAMFFEGFEHYVKALGAADETLIVEAVDLNPATILKKLLSVRTQSERTINASARILLGIGEVVFDDHYRFEARRREIVLSWDGWTTTIKVGSIDSLHDASQTSYYLGVSILNSRGSPPCAERTRYFTLDAEGTLLSVEDCSIIRIRGRERHRSERVYRASENIGKDASEFQLSVMVNLINKCLHSVRENSFVPPPSVVRCAL